MYGPPPSGDPDRLVIYPSRAKTLLVLVGAIGFVAVCVWVTRLAPRVAFFEVIIAAIGVPFFGACALYAAYRLVRRRPALEIDATGITEASNAFSVGRLGWEEVDHVRVHVSHGQPLLGIFPRDLEGFLLRQPSIRRAWIKLNIRLGYAPLNVAQVILPMSIAELVELIHTRYGVRVVNDA